MKILVICLALAVASAFDITTEWEMWKRQHGKQYATQREEMIRRTAFESNVNYINNHNANSKLHGFTLDLNEYADMDGGEFSHTFNGYVESMKPKRSSSSGSNTTGNCHESTATCPDTVDWRTKGYVTPVKNQGQCGSCWAFSTTGSTEGQHFRATGKLVSLSEQNLVDCSKENHGCQGGLMDLAFKYIISNKGDDTETSYPYKGENGQCHFSSSNVGATLSSYQDVPTKNCDDLRQAICHCGPISVAMDASHMSFQLYSSGIYDPFICSATKLDHGVLAVGYGTEDGKNYFLVKNSWGTSWGMDGYFKIIDRNDKCGICTQASYPIV